MQDSRVKNNKTKTIERRKDHSFKGMLLVYIMYTLSEEGKKTKRQEKPGRRGCAALFFGIHAWVTNIEGK